MPFRDLKTLDWGLLPYSEAFERQKALVEARINGSLSDRLVLVEHPPVVTIGRSGGLKDLRISKEALNQKGVALYQVDRGGMATIHSPGQLVAYPIIKLQKKDLHQYLYTLLHTVAAVLRIYRLKPAFRKGRPGIWVGPSKIASVGIAVRRWVAYHGIALNVNADLKTFNLIVPCGHPGETITSIEQELGKPVDLKEVKHYFIKEFRKSFKYTDKSEDDATLSKHPAWLRRPAPCEAAINQMEKRLHQLHLATVCQNAQCPNLGECFERGTATFMILGTHCTRRCQFCAVNKGIPQKVDPEEPARVARAAQLLDLKHVVVTSVTRDDLQDGGAEQFCQTIICIRKRCKGASTEVLVPDFSGSIPALKKLCDARPDMFNHNIETIKRLYPTVRPQADYRRSLGVLEYAARAGLPVKSGLMLGLGETQNEVIETLTDLKRSGCRYLTIGQYLAPSEDHLPVVRFLLPEEFEGWAETARSMGFSGVAAGPLVRSSYRADEMFETAQAIS
jgi:lipoyl synthase